MNFDHVPTAALTNDNDRSVESDDNSILFAAVPCCKAPEVSTEVVVPPPRQ